MIGGLAEAAQDVSPAEMMRLQRELGSILLRDPDIAGFASQTGSTGGNGNAQTANTARFFIALKPRDQRKLSATQIIDRLRPQIAKVEGANLFLQATQDITVGGRSARASFQYTLQDPDIPELVEWSQKLLRQAANARRDRRCLDRSAGERAADQGDDQSRPSRAFRHNASGDRRHAQRRLWPTPDHPVFHPARYLLGHFGSGAGAAAKLRPRLIASMSNRR